MWPSGHLGLPESWAGKKLEHLQARHPFIDRASPVVLADYVTTDTGTGAVHTAPGHGLEDYQTGLKYGLDIYCPLDDHGRYVNDGKIPAELVGVSVLELKGKCPANDKVLEMLTARGALLANHPYSHQYPHCWRSKTPVVFRAMDQWFIGLDKPFADAQGHPQHSLRSLAQQSIGGVQWIPAGGENRIRGAVESRPDWCISRQRSWGLPIPAFFGPNNEAHLDGNVIRALADKFEKYGSNFWFEQDAEALLAGIAAAKDWPRPLKKSADTLDVWLDSGCSHAAVLKRTSRSSPGPPTSISKAPTSTAAGSKARFGPRWRRMARRRIAPCSPTDLWWTKTAANFPRATASRKPPTTT